MQTDSQLPNVVFVLTDDQGYPPLGVHGHPFIQTPHLDAFHNESVCFENFHSGTTCAPTRAGLMTGHYCNSAGVWHTIGGRSLLRRNEWTLAQALKDNGYITGMFGKWHLGDEYPYRPQDRGFDVVINHGGGGISQQPDWWGNDYFDDTYMVNGVPKKFEGYCTDVFFAEALKFMEQNKGRPFFCYISTNAPHSPFNVPLKYRDIYMKNTSCEAYARFLGMITNIDENFGKLRKKLQELDIEDNTILIFMSDNGQTPVSEETNNSLYNCGMRGLKSSPYEGGHKIPFFIRWPNGNIASHKKINELAAYIDFMPTILELCNVNIPENLSFHGKSLVPLLYDKDTDFNWHERILVTDTQRIAHPIKWRMSCVMQNMWRLVNRDELYNLENDPSQKINIADKYPDLVKKMQKAYDEWWDICSEQIKNDIPISIGADCQEIAVLRTHDLRNEEDLSIVWNQAQVRKGCLCHGYWEIFVEKDGIYEFELRRWPEEAGHPITAGIEGTDIEYYKEGIQPGVESLYEGGKSLPFDTAYLDITGHPQLCKKVTPKDTGVKMITELKHGNYHIRAQFANCADIYTSAYYVYVKRLS